MPQDPVSERPLPTGPCCRGPPIGGRLLNVYFSFGNYDGILIAEAPDEVSLTSALIAAIAPGHVKATKTTVLLPPQQAVEAMRRAGGYDYQSPGRGGPGGDRSQLGVSPGDRSPGSDSAVPARASGRMKARLVSGGYCPVWSDGVSSRGVSAAGRGSMGDRIEAR